MLLFNRFHYHPKIVCMAEIGYSRCLSPDGVVTVSTFPENFIFHTKHMPMKALPRHIFEQLGSLPPLSFV